MANKIATTAAAVALAVTLGGLGWTVTERGSSTEEVDAFASAPTFSAIEVLPGQAGRRTGTVGPSMPANPPSEPAKPAEPKAQEQKSSPEKEAPKPRTNQKREEWKPAVLQVVTNFAQADVTVNGLSYPEYYAPGEQEGMVLPAGGPYNVLVKFGSNTKEYNLHLRPYETRLLLVELTGYNSGAPAPPPAKKPAPAKKEEPKKEEEKKDEKTEGGQITVYSKPAGTVITDGKETGEKTPGTVDLANGRHEIQVKYETGTVSEKKIVRVRNGSRIKLFFRERK